MNDALNSILGGLEQGIVSAQDVDALNKAISAGYGGAGKPTDLTYGGVLQAESLEATLKSVKAALLKRKIRPTYVTGRRSCSSELVVECLTR